MDLLQEFYETTLEALKDAKNDRLWFKTNTKVITFVGFFFFFFGNHGWVFSRNYTRVVHLLLLNSCDFNHLVSLIAWETVFRTRRIWKASKNLTAVTSVLPGRSLNYFIFVFLVRPYPVVLRTYYWLCSEFICGRAWDPTWC